MGPRGGSWYRCEVLVALGDLLDLVEGDLEHLPTENRSEELQYGAASLALPQSAEVRFEAIRQRLLTYGSLEAEIHAELFGEDGCCFPGDELGESVEKTGGKLRSLLLRRSKPPLTMPFEPLRTEPFRSRQATRVPRSEE
jgi:hypothetical protein